MIVVNRFFQNCLFATLIWIAAGVNVAQSTEPLPKLKPIPSDRAATISSVLTDLLNAIDRSQFDLDERLESLDFDDKEIIDFVVAEIAYEDYPGVLRGAKGTLVSRAGNSLDQAILLAHLLKNSGLDARIAQGSIHHSLLLAALFQQRPHSLSAFSEPEVLNGVQARLMGSTADSREISDEQKTMLRDATVKLPDSLTALSEKLQKELRKTGHIFGVSSDVKPKDKVPYFWVEYRVAPAKPWQAVHPALGTEPAPDEIAAETYLVDSIDEALQQRIRVQAFIDRTRGGKLETLPVTPRYEYPAANLSGVTFTYSVIPSAFLASDDSTGARGEELLAASELFFPVFDFGAGSLKQAFDINGTVMSADNAANAMAPLFQKVGNSFLAASDALGSNKTSSKGASSSTHVMRHWIEITLLRPGQHPKIITRDIAHWQDDVNLFKQSLARSVFFRVETGRISTAKFLDRNLSTQQEVLKSLASDTPLEMNKGLIAQFSEDAEVFLLTSDVIAAQNEEVISYRAEPAIVARYFPYGRIDASREGFDIINAPRYAVSKVDRTPHAAATSYSGIADTWLEYKLFAGEKWSRSAYGRLQQRLDNGGALTVLSVDSKPLIESLPEQAKANIKKDLSNGRLVVLSGDPKSCDAWWRVDPASGETLGMLSNGWGGAELSEYLQELAVIHGKFKIVSLTAGCGLIVPFITASAALNALQLLQMDSALGHSGMDICSQLPPNLQAMCVATVAAANMAAATGVAGSGLSASVLMRMCVMSAL